MAGIPLPILRTRAALRFIIGYQETHGGASPSLQEISGGIGLASKGGVHRMLRRMEDHGLIRRLAGARRAIEVVRPVSVPRAADGAPLYFIPVHEGHNG